MKKKSALIGFIIITVIFALLLLVNFIGASEETKGWLSALAPLMYFVVVLVYLLLVTLFNLIKGIVEWSKTPPEQRLPFFSIFKKHSLVVFLLILALLTFLFGRQDRGNQPAVGTPDDSWYSR